MIDSPLFDPESLPSPPPPLALSTRGWIIPRAVGHSARESGNCCQQEQKSFMRTTLKGKVILFQKGRSPGNPLLTGTQVMWHKSVLPVKASVGTDLLQDHTGSLPQMERWTPTLLPPPQQVSLRGY